MSTHQVPAKVRQFATQFQCSVIALALMGICPLPALAQAGHSHPKVTQHNEQTAEQDSQPTTLLKAVREVTTRFHDVKVAESAGYKLEFGCVSGDDFGAMGQRRGSQPSPDRALRGST
jgi:hypothetical protein